MQIAIIGASKGVGFETLKRALERGHIVKSLARSEANLPYLKHWENHLGSALEKEEVQAVIQNAEAIIVTLGQGKKLSATTLFSDFIQLLIELQEELQFNTPVIVLSGFGASESLAYLPFFQKWAFKTLLRKVYRDKAKMEELILHSSLNWLIVRPGKLHNGLRTENYRKEIHLFEGIQIGKISRADVADYMVKQAEQPSDLGNIVALSGR